MADVNAKFSTTGVGTFKQDFKQASQSVKTLDSELKVAAAQYNATGNKQEYMRQKTAILAKQIKEQQNAVKAAEGALKAMEKNGVKPTSTAYQKMAQQVADAKARLITMESEAKNVRRSIKDTGDEVKHFNEQLESIKKFTGFQALATGFKSVGSIITSTINSIKNAISGAVNFEVNAARTVDDLNTAARNYGVSTQDYQRMVFASSVVSDTSVEAFLAAQNRLLKGFNASDPWLDVGGTAISVMDGNGAFRNKEDVFWDVMTQIGNIAKTDDTLADQIAQNLFGRSFSELKGFSQDGARENWQAAMEKASVNSDETVKELQDLNDKLDLLQNKWSVLLLKIAGKFAGATVEGADSVEDVIDAMSEWLDSPEANEMFSQINQLIVDIADMASDFVKDGGVVTILSGIKSAVDWIVAFFGNGDTDGDGKKDQITVDDAVTAAKVGVAALSVAKVASFGVKLASLFGGATAGTTAVVAPTVATTAAANAATPAALAAGGGSMLGNVAFGGAIFAAAAAYIAGDTMSKLEMYRAEMEGRTEEIDRWLAENDDKEITGTQADGLLKAMSLYLNTTANPNADEVDFIKMLGSDADYRNGFYLANGITAETQAMLDSIFEQIANGYNPDLGLYQEAEAAILHDIMSSIEQGTNNSGLLSGYAFTPEQMAKLMLLDSQFTSGNYTDLFDQYFNELSEEFGEDLFDQISDQMGTGLIPYLSSLWFGDGLPGGGSTVNGDQYNTEDNSVTVESMTVYTTESGDEFINSLRNTNIGGGLR